VSRLFPLVWRVHTSRFLFHALEGMFSQHFANIFVLLVVLDIPSGEAWRSVDLTDDTASSKPVAEEEAKGLGPGIERKTIRCFPWTLSEKPNKVYFTPNYHLEHVNTETAKSYRGSHYQLTLKSGQQIKILMPKIAQDSDEANCGTGIGKCYLWSQATGEVNKRNCFAFATHNGYQIPAGGPGREGKSPLNMPAYSSAANVAKAMKIEGAIYLGHNLIVDQVNQTELRPDARYYIVAVYIQPGQEYHFHGLFANGWFWTSSKISGNVFKYEAQTEYPHLEEQCPSGSMFKKMKANPSYSDKLGGFYLFPCRMNCA